MLRAFAEYVTIFIMYLSNTTRLDWYSRVDVVVVVVEVYVVPIVDVVLQVLSHVSQQPGSVEEALVRHPQAGGDTQVGGGQLVGPGRGDRSLNIRASTKHFDKY